MNLIVPQVLLVKLVLTYVIYGSLLTAKRPLRVLSAALFIRYDHQHYSKWGAIFVDEMSRLPADVLVEFRRNFGVQWSSKPFSRVDEDHATEWCNGIGKSSGGICGITQTPSALLRQVTHTSN